MNTRRAWIMTIIALLTAADPVAGLQVPRDRTLAGATGASDPPSPYVAPSPAGSEVSARLGQEVGNEADRPTTPTLSEVRAEPGAFVGSVIRWTVQYLGLQHADSLRPDMPLGQTFALARNPGGETGMVYIIVPDRLMAGVATIGPLERFELVGRVITGRSAVTSHPIIEMVELRESP